MNHLKLGKCRENWGLGSKQMWHYLSKEMPPSPVEISCRDFARCAQKAFKLCAFGNQCIRKLVNSLPTSKCQPPDTQSGHVMKSLNHRLHNHILKSWKTNCRLKNKTLETQPPSFHLKEVLCAVNLCSKVHALEAVWYFLPLKWNWNTWNWNWNPFYWNWNPCFRDSMVSPHLEMKLKYMK